jgi:hypothetical protein
MAWNGSGSYVLPVLYSPEINGTTIDATRYNGLTSDVAAGISNCLAKDGQNVPTANLPMGSRKHTGAIAASASGEYLVYGQAVASLKELAVSGWTTADNKNDLQALRTGVTEFGGVGNFGLGANLALRNATNSTGVGLQNFGNTLEFYAIVSGNWTPTISVSSLGALRTANGTQALPAHSYTNLTNTGWYYDAANSRTVYSVNGNRDRLIMSANTVTVNGAAATVTGVGVLGVVAAVADSGSATSVLTLHDVAGGKTLYANRYTNIWAIESSSATDSLRFTTDSNAADPAIQIFPNAKNVAVGGGLTVGSSTTQNTAAGTVRMANVSGTPATPGSGGILYVEAGALKYIGSSGTVTTLAPA